MACSSHVTLGAVGSGDIGGSCALRAEACTN